MANLPEKNIVTVSKVTSIPSNTNVFINANGEFVQASINDVVKASNVVSDATLNAVKEAIDNQFNVYSGKSILATTSGGYATDFTAYGASSQKQGNFFDGELVQGQLLENGTVTIVPTAVTSKNPIPCNEGDTVKLIYDKIVVMCIGFFDKSMSPISRPYGTNVSEYEYVAPANTKYVKFDIRDTAGITPSTTGTITVTVNGSTSYPNPTYPQEILSNGHRGYFDGELLQGVYLNASGEHASNYAMYVCSKNPVPCKEGDNITLMYEVPANAMGVTYYDKNMNYVDYVVLGGVSELSPTAPANASYFHFSINENGLALTPQTAKHICVTINGKYALIVKNGNKNRLDITKYKNIGNETVTINNNTVTIKAGSYVYGIQFSNDDVGLEVGHIYSLSSKIISGTVSGGYRLGFKDGTYGSVLGTNAKITVPKEVSYILYYIGSPYSGTTDVTFGEMQIEESEVQTDYVPHEEQTTYIPIAEPLRGIGEVKDEIACIDGVYGVIRRIGKYVCDGSSDENWTDTGSTAYPNTYLYSGLNGSIRAKKNIYDCMSDYFTYIKEDVDIPHIRMANVNSYPYIAVWVSRNMFASISEFKTWLTENNVTVHYLLAEETFTPFADQTPFYSMKTYDGVTLISSDAEMEVEVPTSKAGGVASIGYAKGNLAEIEMQNIKTKLVELQTAIVNA